MRIAYNRSTDNKIRFKDEYLDAVKEQFEREHPGKKVELVPIQAADNDYAAKVQQMMRSPKTAPDLVYEDTFRINSDIGAGYLRPLDDYVAKWDAWGQFVDTAKAAAQGRGRQDVRGAGRHGHPGALVQQADLREGGAARGLAAEELGRGAGRGPHRQAEGPRRHPAQRLHGQGGRRGRGHAGLRDAAVRDRRRTRCTTRPRRSG